jgi:hypothetical protein
MRAMLRPVLEGLLDGAAEEDIRRKGGAKKEESKERRGRLPFSGLISSVSAESLRNTRK